MNRVGTLESISTSGRAASIGLVSILLGYLAAQGVSAPQPLVLACTAIFSYVVIASGQLLLRAARASDLPLPAAWPLGVTVTGLALWALAALLAVSAAAAFALWAMLVIVLDVVARMRELPGATPERMNFIGLLLCCAFTAAWCKGLARAPVVLAETGVLPAWIDYFIHGGVIAQFGDPRAIDRGVFSLADFPRPFYHYASFLLPAAFAVPLDQPGLALATSVWVPVGFLSLAAAAYSLGASLAGAAGGVAALTALFVFPDASTYGLRNGFFSFHWNLLAVPGSPYALGSALLAVVFLKRWTDTRSRAALAASAALVGATLLFRFHVFLLLFPAWLAAVAVASPMVRREWKLFLVGNALLLIAAILVYQYLPNLPASGASWALDEGPALERFLRQVHGRQEPTAYPGLYARVLTEYGEPIGFAFGILLVYPAAIGAFLLLFPLALLLERGALNLRGIDAFPLALFVLYAAHMMLAPTPSHHDATDLVHRPFVLLYAVSAIWTLAYAVRWLARQGTHGAARLWQTVAVATALTLPWIWSSAAEMARPKFNWGRQLTAYAVDRDLIAAAAFVRASSRPGDVLAAARLPATYTPMDVPTVLAALTSTPAYLARTWYHITLGGNRGKLAIDRYNELGAIQHAPDRDTALGYLRNIGVHWYVATARGTPAWDPQHRHAAYTRGNIAVYEVMRERAERPYSGPAKPQGDRPPRASIAAPIPPVSTSATLWAR